MANKLDNIRENVKLAEVATNKLIKADAMSTKKPNIINIQDSYESIFEKKTEEETPEDIAKAFRNIMRKEGKR